MPTPATCDVLIVGAGPAGASAAVFLAHNGITDVLLITKASSSADTPRAHITNAAALECLRDVGLEDAAIKVSTTKEHMLSYRYTDTFLGEEYSRVHSWGSNPRSKGDYELASPCAHADIPQTILEPILLTDATRKGVNLRYRTELLRFEQNADGVMATLRDDLLQHEYHVRCKYLIGADGGRSTVVEQLKLPLEVAPAGGLCVNVHFKCDLKPWMPDRISNLTHCLLMGKPAPPWGALGILRAIKTWDEWIMMLFPTSDCPRGIKVSDEQYLERAREFIGADCPPTKLIGCSTWVVRETVAKHYSVGRVYAMGDAVHRHPPFNGLGSNTCVQDAYNLAWKLAYVLRGIAGPALLDSYSLERQPVGAGVIKRANDGYRVHSRVRRALGLEPPLGQSATETELLESASIAKRELREASAAGEKRRRDFHAALEDVNLEVSGLGIEMGQRYNSAAVYQADEGEWPPLPEHPVLTYKATTYPGARLPHIWLSTFVPSKAISTHDLCGKGAFTLLIGPLGEPWRKAVAHIARKMPNLPLRLAEIGLEHTDVYRDWRKASEIEEDGCLLVRPDRFIAWRSKRGISDAQSKLEEVFRTILSL